MADHLEPAPLPCSLAPLPDESLPGLLLRLAHRLERSPKRMLELTGLTAGSGRGYACRVSHEQMLHLSTSQRTFFARATRLTDEEVDALCFASLNERYPTGYQEDLHPKGLLSRADLWVLSTATRYCPACLAGDGSTIQQDHGGAWQRSWRLPIAFACVQHQRLLEHRCPRCRRPAFHPGPTTGRVPLIPAPALLGLHPAQCRLPAPDDGPGPCGQRLDQPDIDRAEALPPATLALQERLAHLIQADNRGQTTSAHADCTSSEYFTDLRLIAHLVSITWPEARSLAPSEELAARVDQLEPRRIEKDVVASVSKRTPSYHHAAFRPETIRPLDPAISACVLGIADTILNHRTPNEAGTILRQLLPGTSASVNGRYGWGSAFNRKYREACSPGLRELVLPVTTGFRAQPIPVLPTKRWACRPQHVPQVLPTEWVAALLGDLPLTPVQLNHLAVCRLVQNMRGGTIGEAARYLDFPTAVHRGHLIDNRAGLLSRAAELKSLNWLDKAVLKIPALLREQGLTNFRQRRAALHGWLIPQTTWSTMVSAVLAGSLTTTPTQRDLFTSEAERIIDSIVIWCLVTRGRKSIAPQLRDHVSELGRRQEHPTWRAFTGSNTCGPGQRLLTVLHDYALEIAHQVDTAAVTASAHK